MNHKFIGLGAVLGCCLLLTAAAQAGDTDRSITDRKNFFPQRKQMPLKGVMIGLLVYDGQPVLSLEGRSGPANQLCFAVAGCSYLWVYVPALENPMITNLQVPVGDKGAKQIYPALNMASPPTVTHWGITRPYTLVEVQVNNNLGSPVNDSFVATHMKVVEGTKKYPLQAAAVVEMLKKQYAADLVKMEPLIQKTMQEAGQKALKDRKATGPREKTELMFVTWLADSERMRVHFRTKISDGAYSMTEGGGPRRVIEEDTPPPPANPAKELQARAARVRPPLGFKIKTGVTFGVEVGMAYEVSSAGKLVLSQTLPPEPFQQNLNSFRDFPLPPNPRLPLKEGK